MNLDYGVIVKFRDSWGVSEKSRVQRFWVELNSKSQNKETVSAIAYVQLVGNLKLGQKVVLNTNALNKGLGTGGDAFIVASFDQDPQELEPSWGHLVKARYLPQQLVVDAIDDPHSKYYDELSSLNSLNGKPVVVGDLHSQLPAIIAGAKLTKPNAKVVYIYPDWAALPAAYSRLNAKLREQNYLHATITCGQAFGGDYEAVTVPSALLFAAHILHADLMIVLQGPGNLGSNTKFGYSGLLAAEVFNQATALGGEVYAALRVSQADARSRHQGLSHHSQTVLKQFTYPSVKIPLLNTPLAPITESNNLSEIVLEVNSSVEKINEFRRNLQPALGEHQIVNVAERELLAKMQAMQVNGISFNAMGRSLHEDLSAFMYSAIAGKAALAGAN